MPDGRLAILDWGLVVRVDPELQARGPPPAAPQGQGFTLSAPPRPPGQKTLEPFAAGRREHRRSPGPGPGPGRAVPRAAAAAPPRRA